MLPPSCRMCSIRAPQLAARLRIKAGGRLVEQQQRGLVDDRDVQGEALLLSAGELLERLVCFVLEPDPAQAVGDLLVGEPHPVEPGVQPHDLRDLQLGLEAGRLKLNSHSCLGLRGVAPAVDAVEQDRPRLGLDQSFDRAQRARLAGSVWPQQSEDLSPADLEADRVDCRLRPISDCQVAHLEDPANRSGSRDVSAAVLGGYLGLGARGSARVPAAAIRPRAPQRRCMRVPGRPAAPAPSASLPPSVAPSASTITVLQSAAGPSPIGLGISLSWDLEAETEDGVRYAGLGR